MGEPVVAFAQSDYRRPITMNESIIITEQARRCFSAHASLAAPGVKLRQLKLWDPIRETVRIAQKTAKYAPAETRSVLDGFLALLAGAQGLVAERVNKRVRADPGLQAAFGRTGCEAVWTMRMPSCVKGIRCIPRITPAGGPKRWPKVSKPG
jgi:hypothetical protein